ncbi:MAG: hypothetical protein K8J31_11570, partial [Anaerolineae bacterium]|nr:hypothetical protein [Anaerolineae bacterium]
MPEGGVSFNLDDLKDAVPKFRAAVEDIRQVASTVDSALKGLGSAGGGSRNLASRGYENQLEFITDRLQKAVDDYEEVLITPVEGGPNGGPWKPGPGNGNPGDDDDDDTNWPGDDKGKGKGPGSG